VTAKPAPNTSGRPTRLYVYDAICERIVDGDTVILDVDLGGHVHAHWTVRLRGIDAPSSKSEPGKASIAALTRLLFQNGKPEPLVVETIKDADDVYGRYLARVWVTRLDVEVAVEQVEHKHAVAWDGSGGHPVQAGAETGGMSTATR
jgi:micrococcal nuclease